MHYRYNFYLVSQHVTNGTVTPNHYYATVDTLKETTSGNFTLAIMQKPASYVL